MGQEVQNFARFYASFNKLNCGEDREGCKESLVAQYTSNRTVSLREMTRREYNACCSAVEQMSGIAEQRKRKRSQCLKLMQQMGIDTTDWARINDFCRHPRIAGREFSKLNISGLDKLQKKLRAIQKRGGLKRRTGDQAKTVAYVVTETREEA